MNAPRKPRSIFRKVLIGVVAVFVALFVIGFIGNLIDPVEPEPTADQSAPTASADPTATPDPEPEAEPTAAPTPPAPAPTTEAPEPPAEPDDLALLQAELEGETWADQVTGVTRGGQLVVVETTLVDPRRESSAEGMIAGTVCYAAERAFGDDRTVQVREADGTTFATNQFGQCEEY